MIKGISKVFYLFFCIFTGSVAHFLYGNVVMAFVAAAFAPLFWFLWILNGTLVDPETGSIIRQVWAEYWINLI